MNKDNVYRGKGDTITGDVIAIKCRKPGRWVKYRMSGQHNGHKCTAKKNAEARILTPHTNL